MGKNNEKWKALGWIFFVAILFFALSVLFYFQAIQYTGKYVSDLPTHIKFATNGKGYSILYKFMGILYNITENVMAIAVLEAVMVLVTWLLSAKLLCELISGIGYYKASVIALLITFLTGIYIPYIYEFFYIRQLVTQPYHNITYYGMRMFSVGVMLIFEKTLDNYPQEMKWYYWILLSLLLALSTAIKPSFFYGFALALLLFLIKDFIKNGFKKKPFKQIILMGTTVVPSLAVMVMQALRLYGANVSDGGSGIALILGANFVKHGLGATVLKLLCGLAFPCLILIVSRKKFKRVDWFVYVMYVIQLSICIIFGETGTRANHGNFYWGVYGAAYILFLFCVARFVNDLKEDGSVKYKMFGSVLLFAHLISSLFYFIHIVFGGAYGI